MGYEDCIELLREESLKHQNEVCYDGLYIPYPLYSQLTSLNLYEDFTYIVDVIQTNFSFGNISIKDFSIVKDKLDIYGKEKYVSTYLEKVSLAIPFVFNAHEIDLPVDIIIDSKNIENITKDILNKWIKLITK